MTRLRVDEALCVGHGRCYALAPDVFDEDERGHCVVRLEEVDGELIEQARLAEQNCPESAIRLDED